MRRLSRVVPESMRVVHLLDTGAHQVSHGRPLQFFGATTARACSGAETYAGDEARSKGRCRAHQYRGPVRALIFLPPEAWRPPHRAGKPVELGCRKYLRVWALYFLLFADGQDCMRIAE